MDDTVLVFFDIGLSTFNERIGRVVIQLYSKVAPRSVENFRALCTGEKGIGTKGKPLHFKGSIFHRTIPEFMIQGGDITNADGSGGESIYGPFFSDENLTTSHDEAGIVSMANTGEPNSNNSQFFITVAPSTHLDGKNVAIGKVIRGYDIVKEISETEAENDRPIMHYKIIDCGQLDPSKSYGINECDGTVDVYPTCPADWQIDNTSPVQIKDMIEIVTNIKDAGNTFYEKKKYYVAGLKYKKALDYIKCFTKDKKTELNELQIICQLNLAAVQLQEHRFKDCLNTCDQVLNLDKDNAKARFRKGQANIALHNYDLALKYLDQARQLVPNDKKVVAEIRRVKRFVRDYLNIEKETYAKMFSVSS